jgi:hypothetical protein
MNCAITRGSAPTLLDGCRMDAGDGSKGGATTAVLTGTSCCCELLPMRLVSDGESRRLAPRPSAVRHRLASRVRHGLSSVST